MHGRIRAGKFTCNFSFFFQDTSSLVQDLSEILKQGGLFLDAPMAFFQITGAKENSLEPDFKLQLPRAGLYMDQEYSERFIFLMKTCQE